MSERDNIPSGVVVSERDNISSGVVVSERDNIPSGAVVNERVRSFAHRTTMRVCQWSLSLPDNGNGDDEKRQ